jgi:predicted CoA-binding protein
MPDEPASLRAILESARTIAVVGLSPDPLRPSHYVSLYMQQHGYRIRPVNPNCAGRTLLGMPVVASLADLDEPVDLVNVFRRTDQVLPVADQAVAIGARCLWQQIGVVNRDADRRARSAGLDSVMDRCIKVEHARWIGAASTTVNARSPR